MYSPDKPDPTLREKAALPPAGLRYRVRHVTEYRYQSDVVLAHHQLHLAQRSLPHQATASHQLDIRPVPMVSAAHQDCFGNPVTYLAIQEPHGGLVIDSALE